MRSPGTVAVVAFGLVLVASSLAVATYDPAVYHHSIERLDGDELDGGDLAVAVNFENLSTNGKTVLREGLERIGEDPDAESEYVVRGASNRPPEFEYPRSDVMGEYVVEYQDRHYGVKTRSEGAVGPLFGPVFGALGALVGLVVLAVGDHWGDRRRSVPAGWAVCLVAGALLVGVEVPGYRPFALELVVWNGLALGCWGATSYVVEETDLGPNAYPLG